MSYAGSAIPASSASGYPSQSDYQQQQRPGAGYQSQSDLQRPGSMAYAGSAAPAYQSQSDLQRPGSGAFQVQYDSSGRPISSPSGAPPNAQQYLVRENYSSAYAPQSSSAAGTAAATHFNAAGDGDDDEELDFSALDLGPPPSTASESFLIRQAWSGYHGGSNGGYGAPPPNLGLDPVQQQQQHDRATGTPYLSTQPSYQDLDALLGPAPAYSEPDNPFLSNSSAALYGMAPPVNEQQIATSNKHVQPQQQQSKKYTDLQLEEMRYYMSVRVDRQRATAIYLSCGS